MTNFNKISKKIEKQSFYRETELIYMFSQLESFDSDNPLEKYFLARSIVVFSYGTLEKFIKEVSGYILTVILENEYFSNNVKDLMCAISNRDNEMELFNLVMHYKENPFSDHNLSYNKQKSYFNTRDSINEKTLSYIIKILNLNKKEPLIKIPKNTLNNLCKVRMNLAHGDYLSELERFNVHRSDLTMEMVDEYIDEKFKLNDLTKSELLELISSFKTKVLELLSEIEEYVELNKII